VITIEIKVYTPKEKNNRKNLIYMSRPKSKNPRTKLISVRVTEEEFELIEKKAYSSAFTISSYLRALGMNYPIQSKVDFIAVDHLVRSKADLSRIGGLFKMWLSRDENVLGSKSRHEIELILDDLEKKENEILEIARVLLNGCREKKSYSF